MPVELGGDDADVQSQIERGEAPGRIPTASDRSRALARQWGILRSDVPPCAAAEGLAPERFDALDERWLHHGLEKDVLGQRVDSSQDASGSG
jgi:hypothetical protein